MIPVSFLVNKTINNGILCLCFYMEIMKWISVKKSNKYYNLHKVLFRYSGFSHYLKTPPAWLPSDCFFGRRFQHFLVTKCRKQTGFFPKRVEVVNYVINITQTFNFLLFQFLKESDFDNAWISRAYKVLISLEALAAGNLVSVHEKKTFNHL